MEGYKLKIEGKAAPLSKFMHWSTLQQSYMVGSRSAAQWAVIWVIRKMRRDAETKHGRKELDKLTVTDQDAS